LVSELISGNRYWCIEANTQLDSWYQSSYQEIGTGVLKLIQNLTAGIRAGLKTWRSLAGSWARQVCALGNLIGYIEA